MTKNYYSNTIAFGLHVALNLLVKSHRHFPYLYIRMYSYTTTLILKHYVGEKHKMQGRFLAGAYNYSVYKSTLGVDNTLQYLYMS